MKNLLDSLIIGFVISITAISSAKADNMVCRDFERVQIYVETENLEILMDERLQKRGALRVEWISMSNFSATIRFHTNQEWRIGNIIPCIMIKEEINNTDYLVKYLSLTNSWDLTLVQQMP